MSTVYPGAIQDMDAGRGTSGQPLSNPNHITHHTTEDDTIEALQTKVGVDNSAVTTTIDYKLKSTSSINPGHRHTLDNLSDVNAPSPSSGEFLSYNGSEWVPASTTAPDASTTVKGVAKTSVAPVSASNPIVVGDNDGRVPTQGENDALVGNNTDIAVGTGNKYVTQTGLQKSTETYAVDSVGTDAYAITLSPVPTSYAAGMTVRFKAGTANTGTATLNVNGLGAITLKKGNNTDLETGDILANQVVTAVYDGTSFYIQGGTATPVAYKVGSATYDTSTASGTQTIAHGLGKVPKKLKINAYFNGGISVGAYDGTNQGFVAAYPTASGSSSGSDIVITFFTVGNYQTAVATMDATNITLTWTKVGTPTGTANIVWEVEG
jgi:hypothetical protein